MSEVCHRRELHQLGADGGSECQRVSGCQRCVTGVNHISWVRTGGHGFRVSEVCHRREPHQLGADGGQSVRGCQRCVTGVNHISSVQTGGQSVRGCQDVREMTSERSGKTEFGKTVTTDNRFQRFQSVS